MNGNTVSYRSLLLVLALLIAGQQQLANGKKNPGQLLRLLPRIQPLHYSLYLELHPDKDRFSGKVIIELNVKEMDSIETLKSRSLNGEPGSISANSKKIYLYAEDLIVSRPSFEQGNGRIRVRSMNYERNGKLLVITLGSDLKIGTATLSLSFEGEVQPMAKGLFRSTFANSKAVLVTYFKPNYARRLFPCFDEPEFKATFDLSIEHPEETYALSSMPWSEKKRSRDGHFLTSFQTTPKIPTYLFSLAVGAFDLIHFPLLNRVPPIAIYAPKGLPSYCFDMLYRAIEALDTVNLFFGDIPQQQKIDIVAVDIEVPAMENWGLISINSHLLFAEPRKPQDLIHIVTLFMAQMIHQRISNLVTLHWWDDLWLQDAIVAHLANELTAELHKNIGSKLYTLIDTTFTAMNYEDIPGNARTIKGTDLNSADQFSAELDWIRYRKSEAVLRMFARFFGNNNFNLAVHKLIKSNSASGMMDANEWWRSMLTEGPNNNHMIDVARQWTEQSGYPTISVKLDRRKLLVTQRPDLADGQLWSVPIRYKFHSGHRQLSDKFILEGEETKMTELPELFDIEDEKNWLTFNPEYDSYYRVKYQSPKLMNALLRAFKSGRMPAADQLALLSDTFSFSKRANSMSEFSTLLDWLPNDVDDGVMLLMVKMLSELYDKGSPLDSNKMFTPMMNYIQYNHQVQSTTALKEYTRCVVLDYLMNKINI